MKENLLYGIVGNGQVARHIKRYFDLEGLKYLSWDRKRDISSPSKKFSQCDVILILINDESIISFVQDNKELNKKRLVHFSGSIYSKEVSGFHPLMTFNKEKYDLQHYRDFSFVIDEGLNFNDFFPQLKNKHYHIKPENKVLYHSLCVLSGNFPIMLWQKTIKDFKEKIGLNPEIIEPYLKQVLENFIKSPNSSLTGPIIRNEKKTIKKNIDALKEKEWQNIYKAFYKAYLRGKNDNS